MYAPPGGEFPQRFRLRGHTKSQQAGFFPVGDGACKVAGTESAIPDGAHALPFDEGMHRISDAYVKYP